MSSVQPVVLNDGTDNTTLNPTQVDTGGTSVFRDTSVARNISESTSISVTENSKVQRTRVKRSVPLYQVVDGVNVVTGYMRVTIEEEYPLNMEPAKRALENAKTLSVFDNQMVIDARNNGEQIWS